MQAAIESFGQQMTHQYNTGDKHIIMNGYQCYLKRMGQVIAHEIECSKKLGYNLGLKLIRGAYMNEERNLAEENGVESPVWDSLEDTHKCYNDCLDLAVRNVKENSLIFVASHNLESVNLAKSIILERGFTDHRVRFGQLKAFSD